MGALGWRKRWSVVAAVLAAAMLAACAGGKAGPEAPSGAAGAPKGGRLVIARTGGTDSLDPAKTVAGPSWEVFRLIFDTLVRRAPGGGFEGELAERWEATPDGKTWTFYLRKDRVFSNGNPVNADAVVFTFQRILDPKTAAPSRAFLGPVQRVEKVDDYTVRFVLDAPFALLLDNLASEYFGIVDPQAVKQYGEDFGRNPVGSGPFQLKEWVTGERIVLVPNERHKTSRSGVENKGKPYLEELTFRDIPQVETQLAAVQSGEAHMITNVPPEKALMFKDHPDLSVVQAGSGTGISYISFAMQKGADGRPSTFKPPFDDIRVRQAVAHAIDVQSIIDDVLYGFAVRNETPMPAGNFGYDPSLGQYTPDYDPARANRLLDEAGWVMGPDGVRQKGGRKLEISFWTTNTGSSAQVAQVIQEQLKQVGIKLKITSLDVGTYVSQVGSGDMQMELLGVGWPSPNILKIMTTLGWGFGLYNDPELTDLLARAERTVDDAERAQLYRQAQQRILQDAAIVPLYTPVSPILVRKSVKDLKFDPLGSLLFQDVYVQE